MPSAPPLSESPVALALSDEGELQVEHGDGRRASTGLTAHQYFAGQPPEVDEVECFYFAEATLFAGDEELWIRVAGGEEPDAGRTAGSVGWYQRHGVTFQLARAPDAPERLRAIHRIDTTPWWRRPRSARD